mgnify:CR=1 FL=1
MIQKIQAKTVIHKHDKAFPVMYDLNPYRGCTIGCKYCFAQYSHYYIGLENFFKDIVVKENVAECLDAELSKMQRNRQQIKIGGVTDAYQPLEKKLALMPDILSVFEKYKVPIFISSKSDLILRDLDLIKDLAQVTAVDIAVSISCFNEENARVFEPGASPPIKRIEALAQFKDFCRTTSVLNMPILPFISDGFEELEALFAITAKLGIDNLVSYPLSLRNAEVKNRFIKLVKENFPEASQEFVSLYKQASSPNKQYATSLYQKINILREKYKLSDGYVPLDSSELEYQMDLFG